MRRFTAITSTIGTMINDPGTARSTSSQRKAITRSPFDWVLVVALTIVERPQFGDSGWLRSGVTLVNSGLAQRLAPSPLGDRSGDNSLWRGPFTASSSCAARPGKETGWVPRACHLDADACTRGFRALPTPRSRAARAASFAAACDAQRQRPRQWLQRHPSRGSTRGHGPRPSSLATSQPPARNAWTVSTTGTRSTATSQRKLSVFSAIRGPARPSYHLPSRHSRGTAGLELPRSDAAARSARSSHRTRSSARARPRRR